MNENWAKGTRSRTAAEVRKRESQRIFFFFNVKAGSTRPWSRHNRARTHARTHTHTHTRFGEGFIEHGRFRGGRRALQWKAGGRAGGGGRLRRVGGGGAGPATRQLRDGGRTGGPGLRARAGACPPRGPSHWDPEGRPVPPPPAARPPSRPARPRARHTPSRAGTPPPPARTRPRRAGGGLPPSTSAPSSENAPRPGPPASLLNLRPRGD